MAVICYFSCFIVLLSISVSLSAVPVIVQRTPEVHHVYVRSTPSLDPVEELIEKFGSDNEMNSTQLRELFKSVGMAGLINTNTQKTTRGQMCFSSDYFYGMYSRNDGSLNRTDLIDLCPAVLYQMSKKECQVWRKEKVVEEEGDSKEKPARAWGFGFLFVTIISLGSLIGAFVVPLMDRSFYKKILMFMVSLAVGVLGGSGVFHLIPKALGFPFDDDDHSYLWKCAVVACGLYLFFILECSMKLYIRFKQMNKEAVSDMASPRDEKYIPSNGGDIQHLAMFMNPDRSHSHVGASMLNGSANVFINSECQPGQNGGPENGVNNSPDVVVKEQEKKPIATVAWMIIIGDGLHNFIDGLAIGASFSSSVVAGISTSLAVMSEELPHELGDFAILLSSGLSYKKAMLSNFLSACMCYIGLVIGLVLGYATSAVKYIYGIAGGMFLYISLVDMLPEALEMAYSLGGDSKSKSMKMILLLNFAMMFGFSVMLILAFYGDSIEL